MDEVSTSTTNILTEKTESATEEPKTTESKTKPKRNEPLMAALLDKVQGLPTVGSLVESSVIGIEKSAIYVDMPPFGTGTIYGREYINARDIIKRVKIGDTVAATVVEVENEDGYVELSLKEARQAIIWGEAEQAIADKTIFELPVKDANKGGLILVWQGIQGFIPASQLKTEHYPRVEDGDKDKILEELKKLVGQRISVSIISADVKEGKLIFSEKDPEQKERAKLVDKYSVGDVVEGTVTGAVDFRVFIKIEEGLEGLAHISELDWGLVEDPKELFTPGETLQAKIIDIKEGKVSLSVKALRKNPWEGAAEKYHKGDSVDAVIIKYNKHGALASIEEGVAGLVHISEFDSPEALREAIELGKTYSFKINLFEPQEQRMTLSYGNIKKKLTDSPETPETDAEPDKVEPSDK